MLAVLADVVRFVPPIFHFALEKGDVTDIRYGSDIKS